LDKVKRHSKKAFIAVSGGLVVLIGLVLIPYPGPGWLIVFSGLAILSTEFAFAKRMLHFARGKYDEWVSWLRRQNNFIKLGTLLFTGIIVALSVWLLNGFGFANSMLSLGQEWLVSPLFK
jgi:uncharacterized protein (TIGR02611 family)